MKSDAKTARNLLFPEIGTRWICIKEYPTSGIFYPGKNQISVINPGDEITFLAVKRHEITAEIGKDEKLPFWINWLSFYGIPVTIVWWESLPGPGGTIDTIPAWNEHFEKIKH